MPKLDELQTERSETSNDSESTQLDDAKGVVFGRAIQGTVLDEEKAKRQKESSMIDRN
jgi:hypothetical protein